MSTKELKKEALDKKLELREKEKAENPAKLLPSPAVPTRKVPLPATGCT